jgi:hypothetical protein
MKDLKAWEITWSSISGVYAAESRGRAKWLVARQLEESWSVPPHRAFREMQCRRAPEYDVQALCKGDEGAIVP